VQNKSIVTQKFVPFLWQVCLNVIKFTNILAGVRKELFCSFSSHQFGRKQKQAVQFKKISEKPVIKTHQYLIIQFVKHWFIQVSSFFFQRNSLYSERRVKFFCFT
jgi:hypothetical protein